MELEDKDTYVGIHKSTSSDGTETYTGSTFVPGASKRLARTGGFKQVAIGDGTATACRVKVMYYVDTDSNVYFVRTRALLLCSAFMARIPMWHPRPGDGIVCQMVPVVMVRTVVHYMMQTKSSIIAAGKTVLLKVKMGVVLIISVQDGNRCG